MKPLRHSTLSEREQFYKSEFNIKKVKAWFKASSLPLPQLCALDPGTETGIIKDKKLKNNLLYFPFSELKKQILKYLPEDLYYDRNRYTNPKQILKTFNFKPHISQELVFDIDCDNLSSKKPSPANIKKTFQQAIKIKEELESGFAKVIIVYSGRGFHVHVLDSRASKLTIKDRETLNKHFSKYAIDPWVSRGYIRLIRMPYSLNSLVSRIVTPIKNNKFPVKETIPKFLK